MSTEPQPAVVAPAPAASSSSSATDAAAPRGAIDGQDLLGLQAPRMQADQWLWTARLEHRMTPSWCAAGSSGSGDSLRSQRATLARFIQRSSLHTFGVSFIKGVSVCRPGNTCPCNPEQRDPWPVLLSFAAAAGVAHLERFSGACLRWRCVSGCAANRLNKIRDDAMTRQGQRAFPADRHPRPLPGRWRESSAHPSWKAR